MRVIGILRIGLRVAAVAAATAAEIVIVATNSHTQHPRSTRQCIVARDDEDAHNHRCDADAACTQPFSCFSRILVVVLYIEFRLFHNGGITRAPIRVCTLCD